MEMTALGPFVHRLAGRLSGGMKQKLGLACTLVRAPELLLLDEPTGGGDPLSRRGLWEIILQLVNEQGLTVLLSTSYLDEAERCAHVVVLHQGSVLAQGRPSDISQLAESRTYLAEPPSGQKAGGFQARLLDHPEILDALPEGGRVRFVTKDRDITKGIANRSSLAGASVVPAPPRFEDGFMILLRQQMDKEKGRQGEEEKGRQRDAGIRTQGDSGAGSGFSPGLPLSLSPRLAASGEAAVEVRDLVRRFGTFTAVDHVS